MRTTLAHLCERIRPVLDVTLDALTEPIRSGLVVDARGRAILIEGLDRNEMPSRLRRVLRDVPHDVANAREDVIARIPVGGVDVPIVALYWNQHGYFEIALLVRAPGEESSTFISPGGDA